MGTFLRDTTPSLLRYLRNSESRGHIHGIRLHVPQAEFRFDAVQYSVQAIEATVKPP